MELYDKHFRCMEVNPGLLIFGKGGKRLWAGVRSLVEGSCFNLSGQR